MCQESFFWGADQHPGTGLLRKYRLSARLRLGTLSVSVAAESGEYKLALFELLSLVDNSL